MWPVGAFLSGALLLWGNSAAASSLRWSSGRDRAAGNLIEVACPATTLCVAVNNAGGVVVSTKPAKGASSWRVVRGLKILQLGGTLAQQTNAAEIDIMAFDLSCPSVHLCVVGRPGAEAPGHVPALPPIASVVYTTDPTRGASAWHTVNGIDGNAGQIASLTCPSVRRCYALENVHDQHGNITATSLITTSPTGPASGWRKTGTLGDTGGDTWGIACPSLSLCVAAANGMYATTRPAGPAKWEFATDTNQEGQIDAVTCPSKRLCIAEPDSAGSSGAGNDLISTNPAIPKWRQAGVATFGDVTCASSTFCVGTQGAKLVFSTDPAGSARAWHRSSPLRGHPFLRGIACVSASFCVAVGDSGAIAVGRT